VIGTPRYRTHLHTFIVLLIAALIMFSNALAQEHHHGDIKIKCEDCHLTEGWDKLKPNLNFDHNSQTTFSLDGQHQSVECTECHTSLVFSDADVTCASCHLDIHQGQFADECGACHTPETWNNEREMALRHNETRFPLPGVHETLDCQNCHQSGQYTNLPIDCDGCHIERFLSSVNPDHQAAAFSAECEDCHSVNIAGWLTANYEHPETFILSGGHSTSDCIECHTGQASYAESNPECFVCHETDFVQSTNPDHSGGAFSQTCEECHSINGWEPAEFDHNLSAFVLNGAHISTDCLDCHTNNQYTGTSTECYFCHDADFTKAENPNHLNGNFSELCGDCHTEEDWTPADFDHNLSEFTLQGAHLSVECVDCHVEDQYSGISSDCYPCHQVDYETVEEPDHRKGQLDLDCELCHNFDTWNPSTFSHTTTTFPLTGSHIQTECQDCHIDGQYANLAIDCYSCHDTDFSDAENPNHTTGKLDHDCEQCHTTSKWSPSTFDHNSEFPLTGAHVTTDCQDCHINGNYGDLGEDCFDCHSVDYAGTDNPDHAAGRLDHNCEMCHDTSIWSPSTFSHDNTAFSLTGAHQTVSCQECHLNGQFIGINSECMDCHQNDYNATTNPNHTEDEYNFDCLICHTTNGWSPATIDHDRTEFPLRGAHEIVDCAECHTDGRYSGTLSECFACHISDYNGVDDPNHVEARFDLNCLMCHTLEAWIPATFDHDLSDFPLTGSHRETDCQECHVNGQYSGISQLCFACHEPDYLDADDPDHVAGEFDQDCAVCHNTDDWEPALFDHSNTDFPLTGAHDAVNCQDCHTNGQYNGISQLCFSCHEAGYNDADDPNHVEGEFDHDCEICHNTTGWEPALFDHDDTEFPLTGAHTVLNCQLCHLNGQYANTPQNCFFCHEDNFIESRNPNHVEAQFDHNCELCHGTNGWTPADFDHDDSDFSLTGAHRVVDCADCHNNGVFDGLSNDCFSCHEPDYNGARYQGSSHLRAGFPLDCEMCHNTVNWENSNFDHDRQYFPIYSRGHREEWDTCIECHTIANDFTQFSCIDCHEHRRGEVDDEHDEVRDYEYNSEACLACHPNGDEDLVPKTTPFSRPKN
jgi:hypothetical protein